MKHIGMIVAVEVNAVLAEYGTPVETKKIGDFTLYTYQMPTYTLSVLHSGMGEIAAAAGVQLLITLCKAELIINFGVVGGLTAEMTQIRTCVVEKVVHYDFDSSEVDGTLPAQYPEYPDVYIPVTAALVDKAVALQPDLKRVICASADKFVGDPDAKAALHTRFGAEICEMEAAAVALTCNRNHVPCLMIKTVSDSITGGAEEFHAAVDSASRVCLKIADAIIREL